MPWGSPGIPPGGKSRDFRVMQMKGGGARKLGKLPRRARKLSKMPRRARKKMTNNAPQGPKNDRNAQQGPGIEVFASQTVIFLWKTAPSGFPSFGWGKWRIGKGISGIQLFKGMQYNKHYNLEPINSLRI